MILVLFFALDDFRKSCSRNPRSKQNRNVQMVFLCRSWIQRKKSFFHLIWSLIGSHLKSKMKGVCSTPPGSDRTIHLFL